MRVRRTDDNIFRRDTLDQFPCLISQNSWPTQVVNAHYRDSDIPLSQNESAGKQIPFPGSGAGLGTPIPRKRAAKDPA